MSEQQRMDFLNNLPAGSKWRYELSPAGSARWEYSWLYQKVTDSDHDFINTGQPLSSNRQTTSAIVYESSRDEDRGARVRFIAAADTDPGAPPTTGRTARSRRAITAADTLATRLAAVERERDALRAALAPFAEVWEKGLSTQHEHSHGTALWTMSNTRWQDDLRITAQHCRDAYTALLGKETPDGQ